MATSLVDPRQLKRIRLQAGLTQAGLAKAAGVSQSIIAKVEAGATDPTYGTLQAISRALNSGLATKGKRAADVMSSPVIGVQGSTKLAECVTVMKKRSISQMPVFEGKKMIGTVTESQIMSLVLAAANPREILEQVAADHALPVYAVVGKDTPIEALFSLLKYMPAVLVGSGEDVEGIITKIDLLSAGT